MSFVISNDGTRIAFERSGSGPALILVDGALCSRAFGPTAKLAAALATDFTVYRYDRRGRGQSGDTQPYSSTREVEDLAALIDVAGGSASLLGLSSGGALSLHAAAAGLGVAHVIAYEPPYVEEERSGTFAKGNAAYESELKRRLASGDRAGAVTYFMRDMVGAPAFVPIMMRLMPWVWGKLKAVAHTLPYDAAVMTEFRVPRMRFGSIRCPVLALNGTKTDPRLKAAVRAIAVTVPHAQHAELAGQRHNVNPGVLASTAVAFLTAATPVGSRATPVTAKGLGA